MSGSSSDAYVVSMLAGMVPILAVLLVRSGREHEHEQPVVTPPAIVATEVTKTSVKDVVLTTDKP
jgi:hypothetical protein